MKSSAYTLGVVTCRLSGQTPPFNETGYFKDLTIEGASAGIQLIIFPPMNVNWKTRRVTAWRYHPPVRRWLKESHPIPYLIYDRCYYTDTHHYRLYKPYIDRLRRDPSIHLLGKPLSGKLQTHLIVQKSKFLTPFLLPTKKLTSTADLISGMKQYASVLIKPNGGSHGKGVAAIVDQDRSFRVGGRSKTNRPFHLILHSENSLINWVRRFIGQTPYIIQPFLHLKSIDGRPFDIRILVQKNGEGKWVTTGTAVRTGKPGSLTSNLHGGGHAENTEAFLSKNYSPEKAKDILQSIQYLSENVPIQIEQEHGRLLELGLDVGVDRQGNVWFLEANSKPGRSVFLQTGDREVQRQSVRLPIQYALTLFKGLTGGYL
ncbi:glutathione synthase/RimK-type ligase-like ATP-grasp enzyme [Kroppenstedtia sanguinis]|uniref:YheC/YheD family protein n=1 Tax=Kroppenstedtia sanguinis TaxID=1380684 RepID=A0ABW4C5I9_9BACL